MLGLTKKISMLAVLGLALAAGMVFAFHDGRSQGSEKSLAVVTYNVGTLNGEKPQMQAVVAAIGKKGAPDLVLLQEAPDEAFAVGIAQGLSLPFHVFGGYQASGVGYGLAILSAAPLSKPVMHLLRPHGHAALFAEVGYRDKRLVVCSLHLERVKSLKQDKEGFQMSWTEALRLLKTELTNETPRSLAVKEVLDLLERRGSELAIVGGDFNTVPFSTAVRAMEKGQRSDVRGRMSEIRCRRYEDALWPTMNYLSASYRAVNFPVKPRIDYIFHSANLRCSEASVMREGVGDHYPVRAVLAAEGTEVRCPRSEVRGKG